MRALVIALAKELDIKQRVVIDKSKLMGNYIKNIASHGFMLKDCCLKITLIISTEFCPIIAFVICVMLLDQLIYKINAMLIRIINLDFLA